MLSSVESGVPLLWGMVFFLSALHENREKMVRIKCFESAYREENAERGILHTQRNNMDSNVHSKMLGDTKLYQKDIWGRENVLRANGEKASSAAESFRD